MINPYELLGVTYDTPLNDVRKAYYNLALVLHPDKGGSKDEMFILKNSYEWIKQKLEIVEQKNFHNIENDFDDFIKKQDNDKPPKLSSIIADIIGFNYDTFFEKIYKKKHIDNLPVTIMYDIILTQLYYHHLRNPNIIDNPDDLWNFIQNEFDNILNQKHDNNTISTASILHGYGNEMTHSKYLFPYENYNDDKFTPFVDNTDIIEYKEPESIFHHSSEIVQKIELTDKLDDYTVNTKNLYMSDYKKAFTTYNSNISSTYDHLFNGSADEPLDVLFNYRLSLYNSNTSNI